MFPDMCEDAVYPQKTSQLFTLCTLVTHPEQYSSFVKSFVAGGFTKDTSRYQYISNIGSNTYDAYAGLNLMISQATTPYIILCHQDLTLIKDGYDDLVARLTELDQLDPAWAVAGNAGGVGKGDYAVHFTNFQGKTVRIGTLPAKIQSLDENFIILKRSANLGFSRDLSGFHLYGTDIVIQAMLRGNTGYAIDFHLHHHGEGKMDKTFYECQTALEIKYNRLFQTRYLQGTCRRILLTSSKLKLGFQLFKARRKIKK